MGEDLELRELKEDIEKLNQLQVELIGNMSKKKFIVDYLELYEEYMADGGFLDFGKTRESEEVYSIYASLEDLYNKILSGQEDYRSEIEAKRERLYSLYSGLTNYYVELIYIQDMINDYIFKFREEEINLGFRMDLQKNIVLSELEEYLRKLPKDSAQKAFKKWAGKGRLTPRGFVTADRIKNISGMYIPFWLYDLKTDGAVKGTGTKVRTYRSGDYIYTETSYYEVYRKIDLRYLKVPVDASKKMADGLMDLLEPYNYSDLKEFKPAYLAGFIAEKYDYDEQEMLPRAKAKIEDYVDSFIRSTSYQYASISFGYKDIDTKNENAYYSLLPIWMVYYDYKGKDYVFAMNGQTGKVVGKPPISKRKVLLWFLSVFMLVFLGSSLLALVLGGGF